MKNEKPLNAKAYGSIPHLPGSRRGPADKGLEPDQARILTEKARDKHDTIIVQEKLDGSCVAVAKLNGEIVPLMRAGYRAIDSKWHIHYAFHEWATQKQVAKRFHSLLAEGERCVGEWLIMAHGTRYKLPHEPFVMFDIFSNGKRIYVCEILGRCFALGFTTPRMIHFGDPISIHDVLQKLEPSGHGAIDPVEGAVWRVERDSIGVDFLGKYVRPEKKDGCYLPDVTGEGPVWNEYHAAT